MSVKYARCAKCKDFYMLERLAVHSCPSCVFTTYRCKKCGGRAGTLRSITMHYSWFRGRGEGAGGHQREGALVRYLRAA